MSEINNEVVALRSAGRNVSKQTITRKCSFDSGHRVLNERMKCFNLHGHTYLCELEFSFESMQSIGYAIDFKEIKRVGCQWIDDLLDHGFIANPKDGECIQAAVNTNSKLWCMSLNGAGQYCNPTAENIAKEIFLAMELLFEGQDAGGLKISQVRLYETPNCYTDCVESSILPDERNNWLFMRGEQVRAYAKQKGVINYDDRGEG